MKDDSSNTIKALATLSANYINMARDISIISNDIKDIKGQYVTKDEFNTVKIIVYGFVGLVLVAFIVALVSFFIPHPMTNVNTTLPLPIKSGT